MESPSGSHVSREEFDAYKAEVAEREAVRQKALKQSQRDTINDRTQDMESRIESRVLEIVTPFLPEGFDLQDARRKAYLDVQMQPPSPPDEASDDPPAAAPASPASEPSTFEKKFAADVTDIVREHGLTGSEPEIASYLAENQDASLMDLLNGLDKAAADIAARIANPAGSIGAPAGGGAPPDPNLELAYKNEVAEAARTVRGGAERKQALRDIKEKYRAKGLKVDQIGFGSPGFKGQGS